jgi:hypothetical protein
MELEIDDDTTAIEEDLEIDDETTPAIVAAYALYNLPKKTRLAYVDYNDSLDADQVQKIFDSQHDMDEVSQELDEFFDDSRYESAESILKETLGEEAYDILDEDDDEKRELIDTLYERDESDPLDDLKRNTRDMLMRYRLCDDWADFPVARNDPSPRDYDSEKEARRRTDACGLEFNAHQSDTWSDDERRTDTEARKLAAIVGVSYAEHRTELLEIIQNASSGGSPEIIWYGSPTRLMKHLQVDDASDSQNWLVAGTLTFENPTILVIDNLNGAGHEATLQGATITVPFDPSRIVIDDAKANGWSWDKIAGVHKPAYKCDVTYALDEICEQNRELVAT